MLNKDSFNKAIEYLMRLETTIREINDEYFGDETFENNQIYYHFFEIDDYYQFVRDFKHSKSWKLNATLYNENGSKYDYSFTAKTPTKLWDKVEKKLCLSD